MKKLGLVTAAFAAGMMSFAASMAEGAPLSPRADGSPTPRLDSKVDSQRTSATAKTSTRRKARTSGSHGVKAGKASARTKKPARSRKAKGSRKHVDLTTTASISKKSVGAGAGSAAPYSALIALYAASYGVPVSLAHAVIRIESNYRPNLTGGAGEVGLMQIKPQTARMLGYGGSVKGLYNPETNIKYGMKYLAMAQDLGGGTTCGTILKYNAGHAAKRMNPVSSAYCSKVKVQMAALGTGA